VRRGRALLGLVLEKTPPLPGAAIKVDETMGVNPRATLGATIRSTDAEAPSGLGLQDSGRFANIGAGEEIRTLDPNLGKVVLYH
jgi:hypothetical protein